MGAAFALLIALLLFALVAVDHGWLNRPIASLVSRKLGRTVRFTSFRAHLLSSTPQMEVRGLTIANPDWAGRGIMAEIGYLHATLKLAPLLVGRLSAPLVVAQGVSLHLLRASNGRDNWTFEPGGRSGAEFEQLRGTRTLFIQGGLLDMVDRRRNLRFTGNFEHSGSGAMPFALQGRTMLAGVPLLLQARGGPLNGQAVGSPYHFQAALIDGATKVQLRGASGQPFDFRTFAVNFAAQGPNLADLGYLFDLRLPNSAPYVLKTEAHGIGPHFLFEHIAGRLGQSDVAGWLRSDHSSPIPKASAALWSSVWTRSDVDTAFSPIAPRSSARSRSGAVQVQPASRWMLSDAPFPIQNLRGVNFAADLHIGQVQGYPLQLEHVATHVGLANGVLIYSSLSARMYGGRLAGRITLDVHAPTPIVTIKGRVHGIQLAEADRGKTTAMSGLVDADIALRGAGVSIHQAAATASGTAYLQIGRGSMPPPAAYMLSGDTVRAIGSLGDSRKAMALDCASIRLAASGGRLSVRSLTVQTPAGRTGGAGWVDLGTEGMRLTLIGAPVHRQLFHVAMPIILEGPLRRPGVTVLPGRNASRLGLKGALGVALSPVAGLLPMGGDPAPSIAPCR